jgi:hypothetical protein
MTSSLYKPLDNEFLNEFKRITEAKWDSQSLDPAIYGFQFVPGTRWNPGLSADAINEYQNVLGIKFPNDFKVLLAALNGTRPATLNIYGNSGNPPRQSVGVYSYPRDMNIIRERIGDIDENRSAITVNLLEQGFHLAQAARLVPIFAHRYLVSTADPESSVVLSIVVNSVDAIVYANSLREYLEKEFIKDANKKGPN